MGVADGTLGFKVRLVSDLTCVSSLHVRFDPDLTNRPLALARRHDLLSGQGGCDASTSLPDALSKLFEDPLAGDDGTIVVFDTFTNLPVKLFPSANTDYGTSLVELHCTESPDQPIFGRRVRSEIPGADPRDGTIREVTSVDGVRTVLVTYDDGSSLVILESDLTSVDDLSGHTLLPPETRSDQYGDTAVVPSGSTSHRLLTNGTCASAKASRPPRWQLLARIRDGPGSGGGRRVIGRNNGPSMSVEDGDKTEIRDESRPEKLSYNFRNKVKKLPGSTRILFQQSNPKRGESRNRYEKYKTSVDVDSFLRLGGKRADLVNDFEKGFMNIPHLDIVSHVVAPTLCLASTANVSSLNISDAENLPSLEFKRANRFNDFMDAIIPEVPLCQPVLSIPEQLLIEGSQPSIGGTHNAWAQTRLNDNAKTWNCAHGMAYDLAEQLATRLNAVTNTFPDNDIIDKHLEALTIPDSVCGMKRKIAELGHYERRSTDPMDVLVHDTISNTPPPAFGLMSLLLAAVDPSQSTTVSREQRTPPPGRTPPSTMEPRKGDPANVREMMDDAEWATPGGWRDKYLDEFLQIMDTYKVLEPATMADFAKDRESLRQEGKGRSAVIIPTTIVATRKYHADGSFHRLKVRLCAAQNRKRYSMDDTWSPTVGLDSVRFIVTIGALTKAHISTYDVSGAYLNGRRSPTDDVIYLRTPPGLQYLNEALLARGLPIDPRLNTRDRDGNTVLFKCPGNLYGLQEAGRVWYLCAREWLVGSTMQMRQSNVDPCIFYRRFQDSSFIIIALYVDDSLQIMSNEVVCGWYANEFEKRFQQSPGSGGNSCDFLGMTIVQSEDRRVTRLNCPKLWIRLKERLEGVVLPNARAPLPGNAMDEIYAEPSDDNPILTEAQCDVRGILGQVAWGIQACRPAETFAASLLARRAHVPTRRYCKMLLHLCAYCLIHASDDLIIGAISREKTFHCHVDSSWANDPISKRSWFGYSLRWAGSAFCTRAKLQPVVALSSRDAEAIAAVYAVKAMLGFIIMLQELGFCPIEPLRIYVDNKATVDGAHSDKISKDSRHQAMRLAWLRDVVRSEIITMTHVSTGKNDADVHTKILAGPSHSRIRAALMGHAFDMKE